MKQCPKCQARYDDSWNICIRCNQTLDVDALAHLPPEVAAEFRALKTLVTALNRRIQCLEEQLGAPREQSDAPIQAAVPSVEVAALPRESASFPGGRQAGDSALEIAIGRVWFNRIGILAIILGVSFFLKYAFDNNWVGPLGRVVLGLLAGLGMIAGGEATHRKNYRIFAEGLITGGATVLYLSIYAAVNFFHLLAAVPGFLCMAVVTLFAGTFAVRFDSPRVLRFSILGGFLTPFLMATAEADPVMLLPYILVLDIGILGVSYFKKWEDCNLLALGLTYVTFFFWHADRYLPPYFIATELFLGACLGLFLMVAILNNFVNQQPATKADMGIVILNGIFYFLANYMLLRREQFASRQLGFFAILMALLYLLLSYSAFVRTASKDKNLILSYLSLCLLFITIAIPLQLEGHWLSIGFITEFTILVWLGFRVRSRGIRYAGLVVAAFALARIVFFFDMPVPASANVWNPRFLTYLSMATAMLLSARLYREHRTELAPAECNFSTALALGAALVLLVNLSLEVDLFFDKLARAGRQTLPGPYAGKISGGRTIEHIKQFSLSAVWMAYSFGLIMLGIARKFRALRVMALGLFVLTIAKVFVFDLAELDRLWRILSFIALGCVLLGTSFAYQKFRDKIAGFISQD